MGGVYRNIRIANGNVSPPHWALRVLLVVLPFVIFLTLVPAKRRQDASTGKSTVSLIPVSQPPVANFSALQSYSLMAGRHLYPYSVIPGGVETAQELRNAIAYDPVVAAHYAGFDVAKARITRLDRNRTVYVSYRLGGNVFWTKRTLRLLKGEMLVTDGKHEARTRCGNRISETPASPATSEEPSPEAFETPRDPDPLVVSNAPLDLPLTPPPTTDIRSPKRGDFFVPPIVPVPWGGGSSTTPLQPVMTLEPATMILLSAGFSAIWVRRRMRRR